MRTKPLILLASLFFIIFAGCTDRDSSNSDKQATSAPSQIYEITLVTPTYQETHRETEYQGEGQVVYRKYDAFRVLSPFDKSPIQGAAEQQPMKVERGPNPGISINPSGINVTEEKGKDTFSSGGFQQTWWTRLKEAAKNWMWFGIIGGGLILVIFVVLPVIFPAFAPIAGAIVAAVSRFFAWLIPIFGGIIEWIRTKFYKKAFSQIVIGAEKFKETLFARTDLTDKQKEAIWKDFRVNQQAKQDMKVQNAVDKITKNGQNNTK